jgi:DNA-binding transcriptional regulator YiaG
MITADDIRRARQRAGESQAEFAKRFRVNQSTLHRWETDGITARGTAELAIEHVLSELAVRHAEAAE